MKYKIFLSLVIFCLVNSSSWAQNQTYAFKVLINKGANEAKSGTSWKPVKSGLSLMAGDELKVSLNSIVSLVHSSGKPLEVRQPGSYSVSELEEKVKGNNSGVVTRFSEFILSKTEEKGNRLNATGAVHRGPKEIILIQLPSKRIEFYAPTQTIRWISIGDKGPFIVTVMSVAEDVLATYEVNETTIALDFSKPEFASHLNYLITVHSKKNPDEKSGQLFLGVLNPDKSAKVKKEFTAISGQADQMSMTYEILLAAMFEENGLLLDAEAMYQQTIKKNPEVEDLSVYYEEFRFRNMMVKTGK